MHKFTMMNTPRICWQAWLIVLIGAANLVAESPSAADLEFYEKRVRPLLAQHCYECHAAGDKFEGNLRLDDASFWLSGGASGPALVAGDPKSSLMLQAIRYDKPNLEMPPSGKLSAENISVFEEWIARGAPAPRGHASKVERKSIDIQAGKDFWAYRPLRQSSELPTSDSHSANTIDRAVDRVLHAQGLTPNGLAEESVLVRRLYLDLHGLPPTLEQWLDYQNDDSFDRLDRLIESLLASPRFGERMGRHWLDIVRYGESLTLRGFIMHEAWRYRDYVVEALNTDLPYDEFVRHQIAGDLLESSSIKQREQQLVATTFLTLGNTNLEEQDKKQLDMDVVDEQLDTIGKTFLAQTLGCARCHDHKFDPIPTRDYYAMAGILRNAKLMDHANVSKWKEVALPLEGNQEAIHASKEARVRDTKARVVSLKKEMERMQSPSKDPDSPVESPNAIPIDDLPGIVVDNTAAKQVGIWMSSTSTKRYVGTDYIHDRNSTKGEQTLTFVPELPRDGKYEVRFSYSHGKSRSKAVPITVFSAEGEKTLFVDQTLEPDLDGRFVSLGTFQFEKAGQCFVLLSNEGTQGHVTADAVQFLSESQLAVATKEPATLSPIETEKLTAMKADLKRLEAEAKRLESEGPKRPMAMTVVDLKKCEDCCVHVRGSVHTLGDSVPRGFLQVLSHIETDPISETESGRRQMAHWLASESNVLTSRVVVNRVWYWLMGQGLVPSLDNFGTTGDLPSHPELLDALALDLIQHEWSLRWLVRTIVNTNAYRRASTENGDNLAIDPGNRWYWKMSRKRLEAEVLRDAMLMVGGNLDFEMNGSVIPASTSADFGYSKESNRRSVYVPVLRNALPEIFQVFDFADPSMVVGKRDVSTVAPQSLFLMNHDFVKSQSRLSAQQLLVHEGSVDERIQACFQQCIGRSPLEGELEAARAFLLDENRQATLDGWTTLYHSLFSSIDFRYRD